MGKGRYQSGKQNGLRKSLGRRSFHVCAYQFVDYEFFLLGQAEYVPSISILITIFGLAFVEFNLYKCALGWLGGNLRHEKQTLNFNSVAQFM